MHTDIEASLLDNAIRTTGATAPVTAPAAYSAGRTATFDGWAEPVVTTSRPSRTDALLARTTLVIPTLNEAANIARLCAEIPEALHEIVFVDGLSTDDTVELIHELCPRAVVVVQTEKGKGAALRAGFAAATGDIIVMADADGSTQLSEMGALVTALGDGADVSKGSRYLAAAGSDDLTPLRSLGNRSITALVNLLWSTSYTDICYGYMAFWRRHLDVLMPECDGFEVETYLNVRATQAGLAVAEVDSWERVRWAGESNLHAGRDGLRIALTIMREWRRSRRERRVPLIAGAH